MTQKNISIISLFKNLLNKVSIRRRIHFYLLIFLALISSFAEIISLGAVLPFIGIITKPDKVYQNHYIFYYATKFGIHNAQELILPVVIIFALISLIVGFFRIFMLWFTIKLTNAIGADLSYEAYIRTLYQPYKTHIDRSSSEVISTVIQKVSVASSILQSIVNFITSTILFISILVTLFVINFYITTLTLLIFGLGYSIIIYNTKNILILNSQEIVKESTFLLKTIQDGLGSIRDILIDQSQITYANEYKNSTLRNQKAVSYNTFVNQFPRFAMETLGMVLIAILILILKNRDGNLESALPILGVIALGAQRMLPLMNQIFGSWSTILGGKTSLIDALSYLEQPVSSEKINNPLPIEFNNKIIFKNINFKYHKDQDWVLNDISCEITKGEKIGFIGETGSGKSTFFDILMCLLDPNNGKIYIDGIEMNSSFKKNWQKKIAHVPQNIFISDSTIKSNIAFGIPINEIDENKVIMAATQAKIIDFINTCKDGLNTKVGERGVQLSGGQRQRIGIARALYKNAQILIFDEATSALDTKTESEIMITIDELDKDLTILMIAHRTSTLKNCNRIIEFSKGSILNIT